MLSAANRGLIMDEQTFIELVRDGAIKTFREYNILPSLTIAQAALESGWGENAPGFNLFGIKWSEDCGYNKQFLWTTEWINGRLEKVQAFFRKYESFEYSILDHANVLVNNRRYSEVLKAKDYVEACQRIQAAGYATDPNYATKLIKIIEDFQLYKYDKVYVDNLEDAINLLYSKNRLDPNYPWKIIFSGVKFLDQLIIRWANDVIRQY